MAPPKTREQSAGHSGAAGALFDDDDGVSLGGIGDNISDNETLAMEAPSLAMMAPPSGRPGAQAVPMTVSPAQRNTNDDDDDIVAAALAGTMATGTRTDIKAMAPPVAGALHVSPDAASRAVEVMAGIGRKTIDMKQVDPNAPPPTELKPFDRSAGTLPARNTESIPVDSARVPRTDMMTRVFGPFSPRKGHVAYFSVLVTSLLVCGAAFALYKALHRQVAVTLAVAAPIPDKLSVDFAGRTIDVDGTGAGKIFVEPGVHRLQAGGRAVQPVQLLVAVGNEGANIPLGFTEVAARDPRAATAERSWWTSLSAVSAREGEPVASAVVHLNGVFVGRTPLEVQVADGLEQVEVVVTANGFAPVRFDLRHDDSPTQRPGPLAVLMNRDPSGVEAAVPPPAPAVPAAATQKGAEGAAATTAGSDGADKDQYTLLELLTDPAAEVTVDGRAVGSTPFSGNGRLRLRLGTHELTLVDKKAGTTSVFRVRVVADDKLNKIIVDLVGGKTLVSGQIFVEPVPK